MKSKRFLMALFGVAQFLFIQLNANAYTVSLFPSVAPPQAVGSVVDLHASVAGGDPANILFRYEYKTLSGTDWHLLRDFSPKQVFSWSNIDEDIYIHRVIAIDTTTSEVQVAVRPFILTSLVPADEAVINTTSHPLVMLHSSPPCPDGAMHRVRFWPAGESASGNATNFKDCRDGKSVNHYIAGLRGDTPYFAQAEIETGGGTINGPFRVFMPGSDSFILRDFGVGKAPDLATSLTQDVLLSAYIRARNDGNFVVATDLTGEPIWTYGQQQDPSVDRALMVRPVEGGTFLVLVTEIDGVQSQILREIDVLGNTVRETNVDTVNRQLVAMGEDTIGSFHHEARRLENGRYLVLASIEKILTDVQGPGDVNVYGEFVVELDENFQVQWAWNSFDKLDTTDVAILDEKCIQGQAGCPPLFLGEEANDWLHMNAIAYSPADGHMILSARHQDAVYKIDYADGTGTGDLIWELGIDGDFEWLVDPNIEPWPWFSHQHDSQYASDGTLLVFDNGNVRFDTLGGAENSRGQALVLDETNMTVSIALNTDLGQYSAALGSAQRLANGNYHFNNGFLGSFADPAFVSSESTLADSLSWALAGDGYVYRGFRMDSLYAE